MKAVDVNAKRILTTLAWALAMLLPGGLPLLALWVAIKAARGRSLLQQDHHPADLTGSVQPARG